MPSFELYKKLNNAKTIGQAHKEQSDSIIEHTWYNDINAKVAYFYDHWHDEEFEVEDDLHPENTNKIPVEVKLFEVEYNSLSKDEIPYHLQFKPSYVPNVPYYDEMFAKPYSALYPIGLYMDFPDSHGIYHRYLIVDEYRHYANQFPTYLVLPCNLKLKWICDNKKYESWCVSRSQNSYNSGVWSDYKMTLPENQKITWFPTNEITQTIFYDMRVAISQPRKQPVVWSCSKVEDKAVNGISRYTWKQDQWDDNIDYIERDTNGNVIGMWCNYFSGEVSPVPYEEPDQPDIHAEITYKGTQNNQLKIGGTARTFIVTFYDKDEEIPYREGTWSFEIDGEDAGGLFSAVLQSDDTTKIKFIGDSSYMGKKAILKFTTTNNISASIEMNIVGI